MSLQLHRTRRRHPVVQDDGRSQHSSTVRVTNIDCESWAEYLGDAPLAMAMLDRVVDGATISS